MSFLILDADYLAYTVACVFQDCHVIATHKDLEEPIKVKTMTELWGHWRTKDGGWIAEYNGKFFQDLKPEDFTTEKVQLPLSLDAAKKSMDTRLLGLLEETGAEGYRGYVGMGDSFRLELSTLMQYKGNRVDTVRPCHLHELKQYLVDEHNCEWVEGLESDDAVTIDGFAAYQKWKKTKKDIDKGVIVYADKDLTQADAWQYHTGVTTTPELRVGLGTIYKDRKDKIRGWGRKHFYWQVLTADTSDNYAANCFSDITWGPAKGYKLLVDCKTDKDCLEALVKGFKTLYPAPKVVKGWRGDDIEIDWLYVMQECFNLAKMLRTIDEQPTDVKALLDKLNITY